MNELELLLAHHESGHAVVARACDLRVKSVSMRYQGDVARHQPLDPERDGQVLLRYPPSRDGRQRLAIASFGGPLAEARYGKLTDQDMARRWTNRWAGDLQHLLRDLDIGMLAPLHQRAEELVARHWTAIQRVAEALLQHGELSGDQIDALL